MGWDIWVKMDAGGKEPLRHDDGLNYTHNCNGLNYTHNCNDMIRAALDGVGALKALGKDHLYALDGMMCATVGDMLTAALSWWDKQPDEFFKKMEPENGWGTAEGAYFFWTQVKDLCARFPRATLRVDG